MADIVGSLYERARSAPSAPALLDDRGTLSYAEFLAAVVSVRESLEREGARPGDAVAICSENCVEYVIAMYGILDAGCAFIPLSPRDPEVRLRELCERAKPVVVFAWRGKALPTSVPRLPLDDVLDVLGTDPMDPKTLVFRPQPRDRLAYVIFTSGSTGEPKGVCISRQSFHAACGAAARAMGFGHATRSLAILPLHFDGSFSSVFPPLSSGGAVYVNREPVCTPPKFLRVLEQNAITHTTVTPTYLRTLVADPAWSPSRCGSWRTLALGGEDPPKAQLRRLRTELPALQFFNRYGPTEATMAVSTLEITDAMLDSDAKIPIGVPHPGVEFITRGPDGRPCAVGETAELYIAGEQLMLGYLNDPDGTRAVLGDFFDEGRTLLKTKDVVSIDAAGRYVFVERVDNIVKRNGMRIALSEIELALNRLQGIEEAACVKGQVGEQVRIVAFVKRRDEHVSEVEVRRSLLGVLPASMSPDVFRFVLDLPRASGAKLDRQALTLRAAQELAREGS